MSTSATNFMLTEALRYAADSIEILDAEFRLVFVNPAFERLHGRSADQVLGHTPKELGLGSPVQTTAHRRSETTVRQGQTWRGDLVARHPDGTEVPVEMTSAPILGEHGQPIGFVAVKRDLRPELEVRATLRARDAQFRDMLERAPVGVAVHDGGIVLYVNQRGADVFGTTPSQLVGRDVFMSVHPDDRRLMAARRDKTYNTGHPQPPIELRFLRLDGTWVWVRMHPGGFITHEGQRAFYVMFSDISADVEARQEMVLTDRLQAIGQVAAGVAHEVNNPLAWILDNLEELDGLIRSGGEASAQERLMDQIRHGAERIRVIVRDLSLFTRGEGEPRSAVALAEVVEASLNLAQREVRQHARIVLTPPPAPVWVLGSAARLGQVVLNLLLNAGVAVGARGDGREGRVAVRWGADAEGGWLEVKDDGVGMSDEVQRRAFEPFYTTRAGRGGTGLGLAIGRDIIESLGGSIHLASRPGAGTTVTLRLVAAQSPAAGSEGDPPLPTTQGLALVVEDQPLVARAIARRLQTLGLQVQVASDGLAALRELRKGPLPDVIVCDLMMPGLDGEGLWHQVAEERPDLLGRFVFMTGGAFTHAARAFLARTQAPLLVKPFEQGALVEALQRVGVLE